MKIMFVLLSSFVFIFFLSIQFANALVSPGDDVLFISNLKFSPNLSVERVMLLCSQENCIIDKSIHSVTILSHYDHRVGLTLTEYQINQGEANLKISLPANINSSDYNWTASIETDITYLRDMGVFDISDANISNILDAYNKRNAIGEYKSNEYEWKYQAGCREILFRGYVLCEAPPKASSFASLPEKEFAIDNGFVSNSDSGSRYVWFTLMGILILLFVFLIWRKSAPRKNASPAPNSK